MSHVLALAAETTDTTRVGGLLEVANAILAGLNLIHEINLVNSLLETTLGISFSFLGSFIFFVGLDLIISFISK